MAFEKLTETMDYLTGWKIPGNCCNVGKDGKNVYSYASGYRDLETGEKMTGDETFYLFSVTKVITCTAAMMLWERGLFDLDTPLSTYLPEWAHPNVLVKTADGKEELRPAKNPITPRHLFTMMAGFTYNTETAAIKARQAATNGRFPTREISYALAETPLIYEPGTNWSYSLCHDLLAALCETLLHERFGTFCKREIFDVIGMPHTTYGVTPGVNDDLPKIYYYNDKTGKAELNAWQNNILILGSEYDCGGAGVISTPEDVARFADALARGGVSADGKRFVKEETLRLMTQNQVGAVTDHFWGPPYYDGYKYGLGVYTLDEPERLGSPNAPRGIFGWCGMLGAHILIDLDNRLSLTYFEHLVNNQEPTFLHLLRNALYDDENKGLLF